MVKQFRKSVSILRFLLTYDKWPFLGNPVHYSYLSHLLKKTHRAYQFNCLINSCNIINHAIADTAGQHCMQAVTVIVLLCMTLHDIAMLRFYSAVFIAGRDICLLAKCHYFIFHVSVVQAYLRRLFCKITQVT